MVTHSLASHWIAIKRILLYIKGTISYGLHVRVAASSTPFTLDVICDVDRVTDVGDRKSTSGDTIFLGLI